MITPAQIEKRLYELSQEMDQAHTQMVEDETHLNYTKAKYEIAMARTRLELASKSSPTGKNYTVGEREDMALIHNEELHLALSIADTQAKASKSNMARIRTQVDITRSISSSIKATLEL
jgi:hypothetical protein